MLGPTDTLILPASTNALSPRPMCLESTNYVILKLNYVA